MPEHYGYYIFGYLDGHPRLLWSAEVARSGSWDYIKAHYQEEVAKRYWTDVTVLVMGEDFRMGRVDERSL